MSLATALPLDLPLSPRRTTGGFSPDLIGALKARGHTVVEGLPPTSANSILVTPAGLVGAADNRTRGALAVGY